MMKLLKILLLLLTGFLLIVTILMITDDLKPTEQTPTDGQSIIGIGVWITMRLSIIFANLVICISLIIPALIRKFNIAKIYYLIFMLNIVIGLINLYFINNYWSMVNGQNRYWKTTISTIVNVTKKIHIQFVSWF